MSHHKINIYKNNFSKQLKIKIEKFITYIDISVKHLLYKQKRNKLTRFINLMLQIFFIKGDLIYLYSIYWALK
jgi:hypothetical protein